MKKVIVVTAIVILSLSSAAFAGVNANARAWIHVMEHGSRTCAKNYPAITDSCQIIYTLASPDADCFPVFLDLVEYQGFDYAMTWPGTYTCSFTSCSPLAIGTITNPGDGISHAWYTCRTEAIAVPGWGWIYDTGRVCLTDHPTAGGIIVGDCTTEPSAILDTLLTANTGCAGIGGAAGDTPCKNATTPTTWGDVKGLFK